MKLIDFLQLVPDGQHIIIVYADAFVVEGEEESIGCMLSEDVYNGVVTGVDASDDVLKLWVKEV